MRDEGRDPHTAPMDREPPEELRRALREAARTHQPDRSRILARVERGALEESVRTHVHTDRPARPGSVWSAGWAVRRRAARWVRGRGGGVAGAVGALVAVVIVGGYVTASLVPSSEPRDQVAAAPTPPERSTGVGPAGDAFLNSDGLLDSHSLDSWSQSNITLNSRKPLTALTVELRIARTGDVADTGHWRTLPEEDFTVVVRETDDALIYRWELKDGRTVPAGKHVFAGQFNHAPGGRDAGGDVYVARAEAAGASATVRGGFVPGG